MTPPPIMQIFSGSSDISSRVSLSMASSAPMIGKREGFEPVAITIFGAVNCSPLHSTMFLSAKTASPFTTLHFPSSIWMPLRSCSTIAFLRATAAEKSRLIFSAFIPKTADSAMVEATSAERQRAFVGMQPRLRQVPPSSLFSMSVTVSPSAAASAAIS